MDFLIEFLLVTLLLFGVESAADSRIPRWLRVIILVCTALVFCAVFGLVLLVGVGLLLQGGPVGVALLLFALDGGAVLVLGLKVRKALRKRARK